jgi:hypothetical protein
VRRETLKTGCLSAIGRTHIPKSACAVLGNRGDVVVFADVSIALSETIENSFDIYG